ncbi:ribose-5-phosphate isomerase [Candidatus Adlerbacteria bacterium RIFCSPHIGHO2_02_FULL_54_18]|uniref:Ribose-5-phosphate isomerase n=2 Tax=Candidatus Adleribacteriota TaxID=1752736 RepID=A0A1F4Y2R1_9BACT|nr:MAG: ribose-5-phosphate isomerase [Candidatus Adlerbacteria bacterium RIFCSPLOWO2_01_FULL_54_21b]OGC88265.1 MAG: ribose-5-phosphate isomerase [Candidatus Adlerbacteria bacterium RIFCSPHIGHO2_02_FULL_54_18]
MRIYMASDHAGFELKRVLAEFLRAQGNEVVDLGPEVLNSGDDYPDYMMPLAQRVVGEGGSFGIAIGGSGEGEAMAANRIQGARAAEYYGGALEVVKISREHNNANILSLGARFVDETQAKEAAALFIATPFSGEERHVRRIAKLDQ